MLHASALSLPHPHWASPHPQRRSALPAQAACLARCNGARVELYPHGAVPLPEFRDMVAAACSSAEEHIVVSYSRREFLQTGGCLAGAWLCLRACVGGKPGPVASCCAGCVLGKGRAGLSHNPWGKASSSVAQLLHTAGQPPPSLLC
jgi:hypothetical protein